MQQYVDIYLLQSHSTCFGCHSYFPPTWPDQATLEGSSCTDIMTCTGGCGYSFLVLLMMGAVTPETFRVILQ